MYKWMYDRLLKEYEKKSKEELFQEIQALMEIECSDRCFANECEAGVSIGDIHELFHFIEDSDYLCEPDKLRLITKKAKESWFFIIRGLSKMNDNSRQPKILKDYKTRVSNAKNDNDNI